MITSIRKHAKAVRKIVREGIPYSSDGKLALVLRSGYSMTEIEHALDCPTDASSLATLEDVAEVINAGIPGIFRPQYAHPLQEYRLRNELNYKQVSQRIFNTPHEAQAIINYEAFHSFPTRAVALRIVRVTGVPLEAIPYTLHVNCRGVQRIQWHKAEYFVIRKEPTRNDIWYEDVAPEILAQEG